jgi:hypothetical protein
MSTPIMTPNFRASYVKLLKAEKNNLNGKMEYSVVALFPKEADLAQLKKAALDACVKKWGADKNKWPQKNPVTGQGGVRSPFRDQAERGKVSEETGQLVLPPGYVAGAIFINLKSEQKPGVVDENVQDIIDPSKLYSGCWLRATVNAYAYENKGNAGVAFGLNNVQKMRDDEPIGGNRTKATDDFAPIAGAGPAAAVGGAGDLFG